LNQSYTTKLHLTGIYVGFTNERNNTWRQVPISGLNGLLEEVLEPDPVKKKDIAQRILKIAGTVFDANDLPVRVLEKVTYNPLNDTSSIDPVVLDGDGRYEAPEENKYYRFKQGPLAQDGDKNPVDGVLLSSQTIVMRTDSVIVEALLGQADALDNYSMEIQEAAARKETIANEREQFLLSTLQAISDPEARAKSAAALFNTPSESMGIINNVLVELLSEEQYITACYILVNRIAKMISVISMGHPPVFYIPKQGKANFINTKGMFLGVFENSY
jgi:hypothetical protein